MEYIIYFTLFFLCVIIAVYYRLILHKEKSKQEFLLIYTLLFLASAFRDYRVGADMLRYFEIFNECPSIEWPDIFTSGYEPAYIAFNKIIYALGVDEQWLIILSSAIIVFGIGYFFYTYSNNYLFSTMLFVGLGVYSYLFTPIRQALAIPFLLFGMHYLWNGKRLKSFLLVVVATMFHYSSALFFIIVAGYPYTRKKILTYFFSLSFFVCVAYFIGREYLDYILIGRYATYNVVYESGQVAMGSGILRVFLFAGLSIIGWYITLTKQTSMAEKQEYYILSIICYCGALAVFLGYQYPFLARYDVSFWAFVCFLGAQLYEEISKFSRVMLYPYLCALILIYMYATYYLRNPIEQIYHDIFGIF